MILTHTYEHYQAFPAENGFIKVPEDFFIALLATVEHANGLLVEEVSTALALCASNHTLRVTAKAVEGKAKIHEDYQAALQNAPHLKKDYKELQTLELKQSSKNVFNEHLKTLQQNRGNLAKGGKGKGRNNTGNAKREWTAPRAGSQADRGAEEGTDQAPAAGNGGRGGGASRGRGGRGGRGGGRGGQTQ